MWMNLASVPALPEYDDILSDKRTRHFMLIFRISAIRIFDIHNYTIVTDIDNSNVY